MMADYLDGTGATHAAARLAERLEQVQRDPVGPTGDLLLSPAFSPTHDRYQGRAPGSATVVIFGAYGAPASRQLGHVLAHMRERHPTVCVAWRHYPDPTAHPWAVVLALAAEAAATRGHFWALTRELLAMGHDDTAAFHGALVRAGLDPSRTVDAMSAGVGSDRIAADVASAVASGVTSAPALFVAGARYRGDVDPSAVSAELEVLGRTASISGAT